MQVLVVDDDEAVRRALVHALRRDGYGVAVPAARIAVTVGSSGAFSRRRYPQSPSPEPPEFKHALSDQRCESRFPVRAVRAFRGSLKI